MEKASLIEYLRAVCEAEEAVYACEETINALQQELEKERVRASRLQEPQPPTEKTPYQKSFEMLDGDNLLGLGVFFLGMIVFGILSAIWGWRIGIAIGFVDLGALLLAFFAFPIGGAIGGGILAFLLTLPHRMKVDRKNEIFREEAEREYENNYKKYEIRRDAYKQEKEISEHIQRIIPEAISVNGATRARIKAMLEKLYGLGIVYQTFQNTIAVHQIRQYLEMGLCDALEGPAGAYAEYMKDVRAQRICDSIQDMKEAVLGALNQIAANQQLLYREMRQVNENIVSLQSSVERGLQTIQEEIQKTREGLIQAESDTGKSNAAVDKQLEDMRKILLTSAQNQYIVQREQLANDWWNRWQLKQPH